MAKKKTLTQQYAINWEPTKLALKTHKDDVKCPDIPAEIISASALLVDICQYARGFESRGEHLFREKYLKPLFARFVETVEGFSWAVDVAGNYVARVGENNGVLHVAHYDSVHDVDCSPFQAIQCDSKGIMGLAPVLRNSVPKVNKSVRFIDDVSHDHHYVTYELPPKHVRSLGADDGCGVAVMLYLISKGVQGTYLFTRAEEVGCLGAQYAFDNNTLDFSSFKIAIEIDRKGTEEIICRMAAGVTASQSFGKSLAAALDMGHHTDGRGSITDVAEFAKAIPECVNIAAGYTLQHSERETTDLVYIDKLATRLATVDWASLVIERPAGQFHTPVAALPQPTTGHYARLYDSHYGNYAATANSYGDWTAEPENKTALFHTMKTWEQTAFIRANVNMLAEFLSCLQLSPAQMHNMIHYGSLAAPVDEEDDMQ